MNQPILTAAFFVVVISSRDVHAVMAVDPGGEPCVQAGSTIVAAAATNEAASPPPWMEISARPEAGKFFQVRPEKGFRAVSSIAQKAGISWRWIEGSEWNRTRDPNCGGNTFAYTRPGRSKIFLRSQAVTSFGEFDKRKDELVNTVLHEAAHTVGVVDHDGNEEYVHKVVEWQSLPLSDERPTSGRLSMADGTS